MKESYRKGVANHPDLDPCEGGGNGAPEALDRGRCRLGIPEVDELRNRQSQRRRRCQTNRKAIRGVRYRKCVAALRSRRPHACTETSRARTERSCSHPQPQGNGSAGEGEEL